MDLLLTVPSWSELPGWIQLLVCLVVIALIFKILD